MCQTNANIWCTWTNRSFLMIEAALISSAASLVGGHMRNKAAKAASARQMAFQKEMSDTSYQRGMKDMQKAGLNPILAGKVGGASTPTGSTYNPENIVTNAVNSYLQTKQNQANVKNTEAQTAKINAETKVIEDSSGSSFGKTIEYAAKGLRAAYKGIKESEVVDMIVRQNQELYGYSAKKLKEFKKYVNDIVSDIFNSPDSGVRISIEPNSIKMPNGKIIYK